MATTDFSFTTVYNYDDSASAGTEYIDVTLEAMSPAGTIFDVLGASADYLYLGHDFKFDMALFDLEIMGSLGTIKWEYYGTAWTEFIPSSGAAQTDPDDNEGKQWAFDEDGAETFPQNRLDGWSKTLIGNSGSQVDKYWLRVSAADLDGARTNPKIKRIQMRPLAAYCSTKDVYELMQMGPVLGGTDFVDGETTPSQSTVQNFIEEAQSYIDYISRKSWRPNIVYNEGHEFNLNGFKLDRPDPYKILYMKIWNGASWDKKEAGRTNDFFLVPDIGAIHFSRYFMLPARFQSYNAPVWRWGAGEFMHPIKVTYLNGRDFNTDIRESGLVHDICKKLAAIDITRSADFGGAVVSGMDRVQLAQRLEGWKLEIDDQLESLRAFELF